VLTYCTGMVRYSRLEAGKTPPATEGNPHPVPVRHVMDLVDVDSLKWESYACNSWPPMKWVYAAEARRLRQIEAGRLDHFDAVTVVSQNEAAAYRQSVGDHPGLMAIPNGVDLEYFAPLPDAPSKTIVFVGVLNYRPNSEGITWFVRHVMPLLRQRVPDIHLQIVGRHPTPAITELGRQPGVEVVGSVPDVREYLRDAAAVIAPLRIARGIQNKVLEAMAAERAIVCSPGAAQGLDATPGLHLLVADAPEQWVTHLEKLLNDGAARRQMAAAARAYVQEHHSWEKCLQPMLGLLAPAGVPDSV
jgi:polysaccharide biosynthesis protein PslH